MRDVIRITLLFINTISFILVAIFGLTGIFYEIFGPGAYIRMLAKLNIPWSYERIWTFMFFSLVILIISYFLRKKFFE